MMSHDHHISTTENHKKLKTNQSQQYQNLHKRFAASTSKQKQQNRTPKEARRRAPLEEFIQLKDKSNCYRTVRSKFSS